MDCAQSRIDNEESVSRCKERRNLMKEAVIARNAFAAGHSGYAVALKNTGAALSDYGHGEVLEESHHHDHHQSPMDPTSQTPQPPPPPPPPPPEMDPLPPSPPPLPEFSPMPMMRAMSLPRISMDRKPHRRRQIGSSAITEEDEEEEEKEEHKHQHQHEHNANVGNRNEKNKDSKVGPQNVADNNNNNNNDVRVPPPPMPNAAWDYFFSVDNIPSSSLDASENDSRHENENENEENNVKFGEIQNNNHNDDDVEPRTPEKVEKKVEVEVEMEMEMEKGKQIEHSNTAPVEFRRVAKTMVSGVNLMQLLSAIDDHFLKASETAQEVSKMLEATRLHYHSNFADNRGNWIGGF